MELSAIIPAYNEEATIMQVVQDVKDALLRNKLIERYEVIVIDDGSIDATYARVEGQDTIVIRHLQTMGYGVSLKEGIVKAKYDTILTIDADNVFPTHKIDELLSYVDDYAMVVGSRAGNDTSSTLPRRVGKWFLRKMVSVFTGSNVPDLNSGMRIFKKSLAQKYFNLICNGFSFTTTLTISFLSNGLNIKYIPVDCKKRSTGKSKIRPVSDLLSFIIIILRTVMYFNPLRIFLPLTFLFSAFLCISLYLDIFIFKNLNDTTTILFVATFFFFSIGLLADLINTKSVR